MIRKKLTKPENGHSRFHADTVIVSHQMAKICSEDGKCSQHFEMDIMLFTHHYLKLYKC